MSNFYCAAPWRGLHINPRGDVKTCCAGNPNMLGNLQEYTIEEILNSDVLKSIRNSISSGTAPLYCQNCVYAEANGNASERNWHNNVNPNFDYGTAGDQYHYPVIMDVRWNNTCNLSCNYCDASNSSQWAKFQGVLVKSGARPYYEQVCDFVEQHHEHIHEVALVGGEPLLLPENERLLDVIPSTAIITVITNMSVDFERSAIFKKLQKRQRVGWSMSFDNIGDRFEYVRYGGSWELLQKNLSLVQELMSTKQHWGGIHAVYNLYNATRLQELVNFAENKKLSILWQTLFGPRELDPVQHSADVAKLCLKEIQQCRPLHDHPFFATLKTRFENMVTNCAATEINFQSHLHQIESFHTDKQGQFKKLWPELSFLCK